MGVELSPVRALETAQIAKTGARTRDSGTSVMTSLGSWQRFLGRFYGQERKSKETAVKEQACDACGSPSLVSAHLRKFGPLVVVVCGRL